MHLTLDELLQCSEFHSQPPLQCWWIQNLDWEAGQRQEGTGTPGAYGLRRDDDWGNLCCTGRDGSKHYLSKHGPWSCLWHIIQELVHSVSIAIPLHLWVAHKPNWTYPGNDWHQTHLLGARRIAENYCCLKLAGQEKLLRTRIIFISFQLHSHLSSLFLLNVCNLKPPYQIVPMHVTNNYMRQLQGVYSCSWAITTADGKADDDWS